MQKLEDEPSIEFENMSRVYDGLREDEFNQNRFDAWCEGQTGYPVGGVANRGLFRLFDSRFGMMRSKDAH